MNIINLTPHPISVTGCTSPDGEVNQTITFPSSGVARVREIADAADPIDGVPTSLPPQYGLIEDLPAPQPDTWYVVSLVTAQAAARSSRRAYDLLTPGQQIRDDQGRVIGCASLTRAQERTEFTWREREAFRVACLAAGGSSDVSAEFRGHGGRYPRNYSQSVRLSATFWASVRRGVLTLTDVPFHDQSSRDEAYAFLASSGATCNDATKDEHAQAQSALDVGREDRAVERAKHEGVLK